MGFLQELFEGTYDGFISPRLYSPFHTEKADSKISPELILFNPEKSQIRRYSPSNDTKPSYIMTIAELISKYHSHVILEMSKSINQKTANPKDIKLEYYMCGGNLGSRNHHLDLADDKLNKRDKQLTRIYNNGRRVGRDLRKRMMIYESIPPTPSCKVSPFTMNEKLEIGV